MCFVFRAAFVVVVAAARESAAHKRACKHFPYVKSVAHDKPTKKIVSRHLLPNNMH